MATKFEVLFGILLIASLGAWALTVEAQQATTPEQGSLDETVYFDFPIVGQTHEVEKKTFWKELQIVAAAMSNPSKLEGLKKGEFATYSDLQAAFGNDEDKWRSVLESVSGEAVIVVQTEDGLFSSQFICLDRQTCLDYSDELLAAASSGADVVVRLVGEDGVPAGEFSNADWGLLWPTSAGVQNSIETSEYLIRSLQN